jgi:nucleotidyltransferase/DNA polymerase involved in DNA repair
MPDPAPAARSLSQAIDGADSRQVNEAAREFIEKLTFATADEILAMLRDVLAEDWMALPPWARNLAYRLACLQRPDDPRLLREAAADLLSFGPDWDTFAEDLKRRAAELE